MKMKSVHAVILGIIIGLAVGFAAMNTIPTSAAVSKEAAGQLVLDYLAANDLPATLLVVNEENGLYKVTVKVTETGVANDVYITKDGAQMFQPGVSDVVQTTSGLIAKRTWFDCLASKGLLFYGSTETNATLLQFQVFGGTQFVDRIYVGCEGELAETCINASITEVPTFVYENKSYTGAKTLDWFVNLTGCGA